jgi:hypothetical protein
MLFLVFLCGLCVLCGDIAFSELACEAWKFESGIKTLVRFAISKQAALTKLL